jgi:hypothetical protein
VQNPANATATPTGGKIPIADGSGKLDGWITPSSSDAVFVAPDIYAVPTWATVIATALTERSTKSATYTKLKEITIKKAGTYMVTFSLKAQEYNTAYGKIYINDVATGTERTQNFNYGAYSESFTVNANDKVSVYAKTSSTSHFTYIKDVHIQAIDSNVATVETD